MNHIVAMSSYGTYLHDRILQAGQLDHMYMEIMHIFLKSTGTGVGTCTRIGVVTGTGVTTGTCIGGSTGRGTCGSTGEGVRDLDYHLTIDGLVRVRDMIYVPENNELKKVILREFHVKPYLGHLGYQMTLSAVKRFYYCMSLKKDVADFVARCLYFHMVKAECKHPGGLLQPIVIPEWKWEVISMDFFTGFPGNRATLFHLPKFLHY